MRVKLPEYAGWMFAQQGYLLHELYQEDSHDFDHLLAAWFTEGYGASLEDVHWPHSS